MIDLNAEKIRDFRGCRYLYKSKHIDNIPQKEDFLCERDSLPSMLEDAINKTIRYFYYELMAGNLVSYKDLQKKFEKIWLKEKTVKDIIKDSNTPNKNVHHFTTEGLKTIFNFYKLNYKNPGKVIYLAEDYNLPISDNVLLTGTIDLAILKNGELILPIYTMKGKTYFTDGNLGYYKMILDTLAVSAKYKISPNYCLITNIKNGYREEKIVIDKLKIRQVKEMTEEIFECKRFLPNHSYYWCKHCSMEKYCSSW